MSSIKETIKAEIERRKKSLRAGICNDEAFTRKQKEEMLVASEELTRLFRFIDSLQDESSKDLEEEIKSWQKEELHFPWCSVSETIERTARHFAEWGRMRFRDTEKSQNEVSENIGYLMKKIAAQTYVAQLVLNGKAPDGLIISSLREIAENAFIYGAEWGAKHLK